MSHVKDLLDHLSRRATAGVITLQAIADIHAALVADQEDSAWRLRPPTAAEIAAHHAAHATSLGWSLWMVWAIGRASPMVIALRPGGKAEVEDAMWRAADAWCTPCAWPKVEEVGCG
ncbi:MAG: hypothetical protein WCS88_04010 [Patescibacteria group bacterium]|jgi:hypothetical protein